jgi:hypothetical protein
MPTLHSKKFQRPYLTIITALAVATVCFVFTSTSRTSQARAASAASTQSIRQLTSVAQTIIHFIPRGANIVSQPEFLLDDSEVGVKPQTPGAAAVRGASALSTSFARKHGLAIPGKNGAQGFSAMATVASAAAARSAHLPPPPTTVPSPRGNQVIDFPGRGVNGFPGLTHLDQRLSNNGNQFSTEPPDQGLCAGNGFVLEEVNNAIRVFDRSGNALTAPEDLSTFFGLAAEIDRTTGVVGPFISDPKCIYDPQTERWFVTELMQDNGTNPGADGRNYNMIAVSQTADPRGNFTVFKYDVTDDGLDGTPNHAGCPCFGDQPLLGFDETGVYQSTNEFSDTAFNGAQVYALSKKALVHAATHPSAVVDVVSIDASQMLASFGGLSYSIQPAVGMSGHHAAGNGVEYFLSALQFGSPPYQLLDNRIAVWALSNTRSLDSKSPKVSLTVEVMASETYGQPNHATQRPGPTPLGTSLGDPLEFIQTNDDRMNQVVYADGLLYSGVNTIIGDGTRTGIAWFAVAPSFDGAAVHGHVAHQGYVSVRDNNVIFPSVAVVGEGKGVIAFTLVGPDYFPSAAYAKLGEEGEGISAINIAADGAGPDDGFTGYPQLDPVDAPSARWGDYSAAVVDGSSIWMATEYIPGSPRTVNANWGTFIANIKP